MSTSGPDESLGSPQPERSGEHIDDAVETAEEGSEVEGVHTPSGEAKSGESRVEQMPEVEEVYPDGEAPPEAKQPE